MAAVEELAQSLPVRMACDGLGLSPSTLYRRRQPSAAKAPATSRSSARELSGAEEENIRQLLNSERFQDHSPYQIYATLLDEGVYLCSISTMYRILRAHDEVRERRQQARRPVYQKPELLADGVNQVWSWDITRLKGAARLTYYYLYVVLDIFSRYAVGWLIAERESEELARHLLRECHSREEVQPGQLTLHADRGSPMIAQSMTQLLEKLEVTKSHSRPHVSNDNPFSESHYKTLKYRPDYPERFGSIQDARTWARAFFAWYNQEHHHSGIAFLTPAMVHFGQAPQVIAQRQQVLDSAYAAHPERFVQGPPLAAQLPKQVWINPPQTAHGANATCDTISSTCVEDRATLESDLSAIAGSDVNGRGNHTLSQLTGHIGLKAINSFASPTRQTGQSSNSTEP